MLSAQSAIDTRADANCEIPGITDTRTAQAAQLDSTGSTIGTIGRFELKEILGQGGFGRVYRAYDPQLDRFVALKVPMFGPGEGSRIRRFLSEGKAAARLHHPNIVPTFEAGSVEGQYYLATQFISGKTLAKRIEAGPVDPRQAADWIRQLADALSYAHGEGIVHRDVKPQNIIIDSQGRPRLLDFGLAKRLADDSSLTTDGSVLGTPAYMSPEQARGNIADVGPASDQYSIGAVLYELLTGHRPFAGSPHVVIGLVATEDPPAPRSINRSVPRDLESISKKAMQKEVGQRYADCHKFADDLRRWLDGVATHARPISLSKRMYLWCRRNPAKSLAVAATLAVAVLSTLLLNHIRRSQEAIATRHTEFRRDLPLAYQAFHDGDTGLGTRILADYSSDPIVDELRGWEWYLVASLALQRRELPGLAVAHQMSPTSVSWSPDGAFVAATVTSENSPHCAPCGFVWETLTGRTIVSETRAPFQGWSFYDGKLGDWRNQFAELDRVTAGVGDLDKILELVSGRNPNIAGELENPSVSADGRFIAAMESLSPRRVIVCDVENAQVVFMTPAEASAERFGWSPVDHLLMTHEETRQGSGTVEQSVSVWDVETGILQHRSSDMHSPITVAWSPDAARLALRSRPSDIVSIWNTRSWEEVAKCSAEGSIVDVLAWSADNRFLAGSTSRDTLVWHAETGRVCSRLEGHDPETTNRIRWSPTGYVLMSTGREDARILLQAAFRAETILENSAYAVWSPDGTMLAAFEPPDVVVRGAKSLVELDRLQGAGTYLHWSPDSRHLAWAEADGELIVWNLEQNSRIGTTIKVEKNRWPTRIKWSADSTHLAVATGGDLGPFGIAIFYISVGNQLAVPTDVSPPFAWSPDAHQLVARSIDLHSLFVTWHVDTPEDSRRFGEIGGATVSQLRWHSDGQLIAERQENNLDFEAWNIASGEKTMRIGDADWPIGPKTYLHDSERWSPDGRLFVAIGETENELARGESNLTPLPLLLCNNETREQTVLMSDARVIRAVDWHPDGNRLAAVGGKEVIIFDVDRGSEVLRLPCNYDRSVEWSRDGMRLLVSPAIWDASIAYGLLENASSHRPMMSNSVSSVETIEAVQAQQDSRSNVSDADLIELGLVYHAYHDVNRRGPPDWETAIEFGTENGSDTVALQRVRDAGYVVQWSRRFSEVTTGLSNTIMAESESGPKLIFDGSVRP